MPVQAKARVNKVKQFSDLTPDKVKALWRKYGQQIVGVTNIRPHIESTKHKKYCILVDIEEVQRLPRPSVLDKTGFGNACAWLIVGNIDSVRTAMR